ncbi:ribonuclease toxin immunity protein CdiI [Enterobacter cloacae]|uniref:ribonuclease toxin immunity protein CdiI n=1 Tax=Enterobacter cloacae TaxID=550 RepID=UPI000C1E01C7|nr:ribonuclease toxin immunity protein CdiI [Enterobacter cloacae]PJD36376.1 hypothetical protein B9Q28_03460 [Enterobacter cloacae]
MKEELFSQLDVDSGLDLVIVSYFDRMYSDGDFIRAISLLVKKGALNTDGAYCHFPDKNSFYEEDHFEGVEFAMGYPPSEEDTVIVSEDMCYKYVRLACERYLKFHPEDAQKVNELLAEIPS